MPSVLFSPFDCGYDGMLLAWGLKEMWCVTFRRSKKFGVILSCGMKTKLKMT